MATKKKLSLFYKTFQVKIPKFINQIINMPALLYNINRSFFKNGFMQDMNTIENNRDLYTKYIFSIKVPRNND